MSERTSLQNKSSEEQVLAVIPGVSRKKGLLGFKRDTYTLVITDKRLIFALVNKGVLNRQKQDMAELRQKNKAEGKGFLASWGESVATGMSWYNRYLAMDPEEIIRESEGNFFLLRQDILSLKIKEYLGSNQADPDTPLPFFKIKTTGEKFKFMLSRSYDPGALKILKKWFKSA